ncbi:hypothetical protein JHK87_016152 [Glycine soja]|nr:hypothetical protein JHK87_016152 [Glycine soja]
MGEEDETPKYNRIGGGGRRPIGRPCKIPYPKLVPQRGLGVAQLEKFRLEQEQKEKAAIIATSASSSNSDIPYDKHLQFLKFHNSNQPSPNSFPLSTASIANNGGSDAGRHEALVLGHVSGPQLRAPHDFKFVKKKIGMNTGMTFASTLPCASNTIMPFPNCVQKTQQHQQQHPSSSMVSVSSRTSSTIVPHSSLEPYSTETYVSKRLEKMIGIKRPNPFSLKITPVSSSNFKPFESNPIRPSPNWMHRTQQHPSSSMLGDNPRTSSTIVPQSLLEPPSNQNYIGSYVSKRKEEKMIWTKQPKPFSMDIPPVSSSNSKPLTFPNPPMSSSNFKPLTFPNPPMSSSNFKPLTFLAPMKASESNSCISGRRFNLDFGNSTIREIPSVSATNSELISKKNKKGKKNIGGDFLTVAPPTECSCSKLKSPSGFVPFRHQGKMKYQVPPPSRYNQTNRQQHWYNVIPSSAKVAQIGQQSDRFQNCNVVGESVDLDLSLKL